MKMSKSFGYATQYFDGNKMVIDSKVLPKEDAIRLAEKYKSEAESALEAGEEVQLSVWEVETEDGNTPSNYLNDNIYCLDYRDDHSSGLPEVEND